MIKFIILGGVILFCSSCLGLSKKEKQILIGEWYSNKEVTLNLIKDEKLKIEIKQSRVGLTSYIFTPRYTSVGEVDASYRAKLVWRIHEKKQDTIGVYIGHHYLSLYYVNFKIDIKGCIGLVNKNFSKDFIEYFCKFKGATEKAHQK